MRFFLILLIFLMIPVIGFARQGERVKQLINEYSKNSELIYMGFEFGCGSIGLSNDEIFEEMIKNIKKFNVANYDYRKITNRKNKLIISSFVSCSPPSLSAKSVWAEVYFKVQLSDSGTDFLLLGIPRTFHSSDPKKVNRKTEVLKALANITSDLMVEFITIKSELQ